MARVEQRGLRLASSSRSWFPPSRIPAEVLRFAPVGFARQASGAGKYKVCFCDSALLPEGQTSCLSETDYSLEVTFGGDSQAALHCSPFGTVFVV